MSKTTKNAYLEKLTQNTQMKSVKVGKDLEGSTPPSVFIGRWSYPKVYAGPMMTTIKGDSSMYDSPENWLGENKTQDEIINYRLNLVRGKQIVRIDDLDNPLIDKLTDISLAKTSTDSEAIFGKTPTGSSLSEDTEPHGPSAVLEEFNIDAVKWDHKLEKSYYDTDLKARDAIMYLHDKDIPFSNMQKAFSVGAFGLKNKRKLVPTRWSITACDTAIADELLKEVRHYPTIDSYRVYKYYSLHNKYIIILMPTEWQYEWTESFIKLMSDEELIFSDYELNSGKKEYSSVGGCFYTAKMAVLEYLSEIKKQAGLIILREAYHGYVPLGVFNVRENIRSAMKEPYKEFEDLKTSLHYAGEELKIPISKYVKISTLLDELLHTKQSTLDMFFKK